MPTDTSTDLQATEDQAAERGIALVGAFPAAMIERLATDPAVSVEKLERLLDLQERVLDRQAKMAFDTAFTALMSDVPTVVEKGKGDKNISFARHEDIVEAVRPVLARHGFAISHETSWPEAGKVLVTGLLTHRYGHVRTSQFLTAADQTGSKNAIQALGSALSYGRRYTTLDLLNIASREDDDGAGSDTNRTRPEAPDGFDNWLTDLEVTAEGGLKPLEEAWNKSKPAFKSHLFAVGRHKWEALKRQAAKTEKQRQ